MIRNLKRSSALEMLVEWGRAEPDGIRSVVPIEIVKRLVAGTSLSTDDERRIGAAIVEVARAGMSLDELLALGLHWQIGDLPISELGCILFDPYDRFVNVAPSGRLGEFAHRFEKMDDVALVDGFRTMRDTFDIAKMCGRPLLVARNIEGPYQLIEGTHRCVAMFLRSEERSLRIDHFRVYVGVGEQVIGWRRYRTKRYLPCELGGAAGCATCSIQP